MSGLYSGYFSFLDFLRKGVCVCVWGGGGGGGGLEGVRHITASFTLPLIVWGSVPFSGVVRWCSVNFQRRGVLLIWIRVGQGPTALAVGAGGGCLDTFSLVYDFSFLSPCLWETARHRLKCCLKGPLSPNQPTNQPTNHFPGLSQIKAQVVKTGQIFINTLEKYQSLTELEHVSNGQNRRHMHIRSTPVNSFPWTTL